MERYHTKGASTQITPTKPKAKYVMSDASTNMMHQRRVASTPAGVGQKPRDCKAPAPWAWLLPLLLLGCTSHVTYNGSLCDF
jgi:hypothetical protein